MMPNDSHATHNIIYGRHEVFEALKTEQELEKIFIMQGINPSEQLEKIRKLAKSSSIPLIFAPKEKLERLARGAHHQGIVALLSSEQYEDFEVLLQKSPGKQLFLILDHIEDPHNLGSLLRTADAVGVTGVIVPKRRAVGLTGGAAKASAGAIHHVPVSRVSNLHQTLLRLRKLDFTIIGADQSATKSFHEISYTLPLAIVLGGEHKGVSFLLKNTCDELVKIPMKGHLDSLNVSVAGALILYQAFLSVFVQRNTL